MCIALVLLLTAWQGATQRASTVTPATIFQVMTAEHPTDDSFTIDGREVGQVCFNGVFCVARVVFAPALGCCLSSTVFVVALV